MKKILLSLAIVFFYLPLFADYYERGQGYYMYKNYDKAREMFLQAGEKENNGNAYYFLGEIEKLEGRYREAEEYYKLAITKRNINGKYLRNAYTNILLFTEQRGDLETIIRTCKEMWIRHRDGSARNKIESLINRCLWTGNKEAIDCYNRGISLKNAGKSAESVAEFKKAVYADSSFLAAKFELGMAAYNRGDSGTALSYLGEIASKISFYPEVHLIVGDIYYNNDNYSSAIDHFSKVLEFGIIDDATASLVYQKRGTSYYKLRAYTKAEEDADRLVKTQPLKAELLRSAVRIKQERYDEALASLRNAERMDPDNETVLYHLGGIYLKKNDGRFVSYYSRLFDRATRGRAQFNTQYVPVFTELAQHYYRGRNYLQAKKVLAAFPAGQRSGELSLMLARCYYHAGEYDRAVAIFSSMTLGSDDTFLLCRSYALSGRKDRAKKILESNRGNSGFFERAEKDQTLGPIAAEIKKEQARPHPAGGPSR